MKIEIDTIHDNEAHIRHAIRLLQNLIQEKESFTNEIPSQASSQESGSLMNMFDAPAKSASGYSDDNNDYDDSAPSFQPSQQGANAGISNQTSNQYAEPDQSGFSLYGKSDQPKKDEAPPGSLFGIFKDATAKKPEPRIIPY